MIQCIVMNCDILFGLQTQRVHTLGQILNIFYLARGLIRFHGDTATHKRISDHTEK